MTPPDSHDEQVDLLVKVEGILMEYMGIEMDDKAEEDVTATANELLCDIQNKQLTEGRVLEEIRKQMPYMKDSEFELTAIFNSLKSL